MANQEHVDFLKECVNKGKTGIKEWNKWREEHPEIEPDLRKADLKGVNLKVNRLGEADWVTANLTMVHLEEADLSEADLDNTNLRGAYLTGAKLWTASLVEVDLSEADLEEANLSIADLSGADLSGADLRGAELGEAKLFEANLRGADLRGADLIGASLVAANFTNANLTGCSIYGTPAWDVQLEGAIQRNLVITNYFEPEITVDNLEVAQFIYLLLSNQKIRDVIDTIAKKVVLILGRFTPERKAILDALRDELRNHNYSPIVFDFDKPASRDLTETVSILARLSRFIIADITDPSCIPQELYAVVPDCLVPVQPLLSSQPIMIDGNEVERRPCSMFKDLQRRYHWVLPTYRYQGIDQLLSAIKDEIIMPAEEKGRELERRKNGSI